MKFKIGDIVRLKVGKSPMKVIAVEQPSGRIKTVYLSQIRYYGNFEDDIYHVGKWIHQNDCEFYKQEEETTMNDLYQIKAEPTRYGTALTNGNSIVRNSEGKIILEMKGEGGLLQAFTDSEIELVTPYTIHLKSPGANQIHVIAKEGQVQKGDVLLDLESGQIFIVAGLNSKCKTPCNKKTGWMKINGTGITLGSEE